MSKDFSLIIYVYRIVSSLDRDFRCRKLNIRLKQYDIISLTNVKWIRLFYLFD